MPNKNYIKGANFEREFMAKCNPNYTPVRTGGSHSPWDVILIPKEFGNTICCQLKRYKKGSYKPKCPQSLKELKVNEDTVTVWFVTKEDYKPYEIEVV